MSPRTLYTIRPEFPARLERNFVAAQARKPHRKDGAAGRLYNLVAVV